MRRPDNWNKITEDLADNLVMKDDEYYHGHRDGVEAGADAMLATVKEDMENLLAYAHGNDQCDDEDFKEMDKIAERWNLEK